MSDRRIVMVTLVGNLPWYEEHLRPIIAFHADCWGADFFELRHFDANSYGHSASPLYGTIECVKHFRDWQYYDQALVLDADVMPFPNCGNFFEMMPGADMLVVKDHVWKNFAARTRFGHRVEHYIEKSAKFYGYELKSEDKQWMAEKPYFNAGVLLFRRSSFPRLDLEGPYHDYFPFDQDLWNYRSEMSGLNVGWLPQVYNWHDPENLNDKVQCVHFTGESKDHIGPLRRKLYGSNTEDR